MAQQLHVEFETGYRRILAERGAPDGCYREVCEFSTYAAESARLVLQSPSDMSGSASSVTDVTRRAAPSPL